MKKLVLALFMVSSGIQTFACNNDETIKATPPRTLLGRITHDGIGNFVCWLGKNHEREKETASITKLGVFNDNARVFMSKFATEDGSAYVIHLRKKAVTNTLTIAPDDEDAIFEKNEVYKAYKERKNSGIKYDPSKCALMNALKKHSQHNANPSWTTFISKYMFYKN